MNLGALKHVNLAALKHVNLGALKHVNLEALKKTIKGDEFLTQTNVRYSKRLNFRDDCTEFILSVSLISWFPATFSRLVFWQLIYKVV